MATKLPPPTFPKLFKHMALAIYISGYGEGPLDKKFRECMEVALRRLKEYKMVTANSTTERVTLTSKGREQDRKHQRERLGYVKTRTFDRFYQKLIAEGQVAQPTPNLMPEKTTKPQSVGPAPASPSTAPNSPATRPGRPSTAPRRRNTNPARPRTSPRRPGR